MMKRLRTVKNAPSKTLGGLKGPSVSQVNLPMRSRVLDTARAVRDQPHGLICKRRPRVED